MPHDIDNELLKVGDVINILCKIVTITLNKDYCNLTVETLHNMPPYNNPTTLTLNTKQVKLSK